MIKISSIKFIWFNTIVIGSLLLLFYIFQVGAKAQEEHLIRSYQEELNVLSGENKLLNIKFSKDSSLSNIENYFLDKDFVKTDQVRYIQILRGSVLNK
ncbi:MAG: hypothetical protein KJI71_03205 [Patescibacteria group bacterium]|nr:hypothetical protein [Patescibacteria group bacterium]